MEMETEARDEALGNPLIVSSILSVLHDDYGQEMSFLSCRFLNKFWNSEVLLAYPRREELYLNVETYMGQKDREEGALLPQGSPLGARVYAGGEFYDPEKFLNFFKDGDYGGKTEVLFLNQFISFKDQGVTWGDALYQILRNNWAPNLREFRFDFCPEGRINYAIDEDQDLYGGLVNLRVLEIQCNHWGWETVKKGPFTLFVKAILRGARNLEELRIKGPFFPESAEVRALKNLKVFELDLYSRDVSASTIPDIEQVIHDLSTSCPLLEDLRLFLPQKGEQGTIRFPRFPKLKKFSCDVPEGDFLRFLKGTFPFLRSCSVRPSRWIVCEEMEAFLRALKESSVSKHEGLGTSPFCSVLCFLRKSQNPITGLGSRFPSLKGLFVDAYAHAWWDKALDDEHPDWLSNLALILAQEFRIPSTISTEVSDDYERAKEQFLQAKGPQYKEFPVQPDLCFDYCENDFTELWTSFMSVVFRIVGRNFA